MFSIRVGYIMVANKFLSLARVSQDSEAPPQVTAPVLLFDRILKHADTVDRYSHPIARL